ADSRRGGGALLQSHAVVGSRCGCDRAAAVGPHDGRARGADWNEPGLQGCGLRRRDHVCHRDLDTSRRSRSTHSTTSSCVMRNARAFGALRDVLRRRGAVVIFPEGISHDNPWLAPLRTGAARIALEARDEGGVEGLYIVPIGLTFERKDAPRTRVLVQVGDAI